MDKVCKFIDHGWGIAMFVDEISLMLLKEHAEYFKTIYVKLGYKIEEV